MEIVRSFQRGGLTTVTVCVLFEKRARQSKKFELVRIVLCLPCSRSSVNTFSEFSFICILHLKKVNIKHFHFQVRVSVLGGCCISYNSWVRYTYVSFHCEKRHRLSLPWNCSAFFSSLPPPPLNTLHCWPSTAHDSRSCANCAHQRTFLSRFLCSYVSKHRKSISIFMGSL